MNPLESLFTVLALAKEAHVARLVALPRRLTRCCPIFLQTTLVRPTHVVQPSPQTHAHLANPQVMQEFMLMKQKLQQLMMSAYAFLHCDTFTLFLEELSQVGRSRALLLT